MAADGAGADRADARVRADCAVAADGQGALLADDVRAKMAPLYPEIGRCLANVEVPKETGWVVLRFVILPTTAA